MIQHSLLVTSIGLLALSCGQAVKTPSSADIFGSCVRQSRLQSVKMNNGMTFKEALHAAGVTSSAEQDFKDFTEKNYQENDATLALAYLNACKQLVGLATSEERAAGVVPQPKPRTALERFACTEPANEGVKLSCSDLLRELGIKITSNSALRSDEQATHNCEFKTSADKQAAMSAMAAALGSGPEEHSEQTIGFPVAAGGCTAEFFLAALAG